MLLIIIIVHQRNKLIVNYTIDVFSKATMLISTTLGQNKVDQLYYSLISIVVELRIETILFFQG